MEETLRRIQQYSADAHATRQRKFTNDFKSMHPLRVMEICQLYTDKPSVLAAALLHDILEETTVTTVELAVFLAEVMDPVIAEKTQGLIEELTDIYTRNDYPLLNRRTRKEMELQRIAAISTDAQTIKYADIIDNARSLASAGTEFTSLFLEENQALLQHIPKGNPYLYLQAINIVRNIFQQAH